ncbi:MAG TPA: hypothetical protein VMS17_22265, partial [Gemmataceae bacterium]|nr:hypothetical protein [Gemmataceae bacterium]
DGELYFLDYDGGTVHTIERNDAGARNADFPTRLSQTGLFADPVGAWSADHAPTPAAGVVPFTINSRQWLDGATAEHWVAFPGDSSATLYEPAKPIPGMVDWHNFRLHFPKDAVLVRTISLGGTRLETQLLHFDGLDWRAYTYAWRDDQTDADLVPADGGEKELSDPSPLAVPPPHPHPPPPAGRGKTEAGERKRVWQIQSRTQCMSCHSSWSEYALAFQPDQLNRVGPDGRNQLVALSEAGIIRRAGPDDNPLPPFNAASIGKERNLADPMDESQSLEARARSYLHTNCGHCHCEGGGGSVDLRLQFPVRVADMKAVGVRPSRGDFGLPEACIIKPGDPYGSTLYFRMSKFGRDRMPHIGSDRPDEAGLKLIGDWIASMGGAAASPEEGPLDRLLADPRAALAAARRLGRAEMKSTDQNALLAAAVKLPAGPIRDLFEGYFPADDQGPRKLGSNPRPRTILSLSGDAGRGEKLFWSQAVNCGKCHKIGDRGTAIGPELTTIGKTRPREDLLESILEPSRRIEPQFAAYIARTTDGRTFTGLLAKRDEKQVVLRDAQNKEIVVANDELEELKPSRISLMPEGQLAGLTPQEAADLLEYLATRRGDK